MSLASRWGSSRPSSKTSSDSARCTSDCRARRSKDRAHPSPDGGPSDRSNDAGTVLTECAASTVPHFERGNATEFLRRVMNEALSVFFRHVRRLLRKLSLPTDPILHITRLTYATTADQTLGDIDGFSFVTSQHRFTESGVSPPFSEVSDR
jgi:hypothetical protein